jgi:hypothetical protein
MGVLDTILQMRNQGQTDQTIIRSLQEKGVPPKEIQDALNQAQIKNAVAGEQAPQTQEMQQSIMDNSKAQLPLEQPSIDPTLANEEYAPEAQAPIPYNPQTQEMPEYAPDPYAQDQYSQDYYGDQSGGVYSYVGGASDTSTLMEIAEQVFAEKIKKIQAALEDIAEFKTLTSSKITLFEDRLKRIETTLDQLQASILEKIGSYGQNLESIKKEMSMMQNSFGKVVNTAIDKKSRTRKKT